MKLLHTAHVPAGDGPFPTLVLCHGWGASAHDLLGLAPHLHDGEALVLCPQGQVKMQIGPGVSGYGWFQLVPGQPPNIAEFRERSGELREWLDEAVEMYPVDPTRLAVGGFSQGGVMAFDLALRQPGRFRGIAALSTWLPEPLADDLPKLPEHESLPVLVLHGTEDRMIEVERARESRERLREFGVRLLYREFPMAHEIRPEALRTLTRWLDEKVFAESP
ncbi:MAG TPA: alpha/beta fold hydrolase [Thermoanaerobaculia bacterium]|nr:alpha/beta fold hydrolase [Thermoanaerobaculia bacterium]